MYTDFESTLAQRRQERGVQSVALRHKIERGPEPQAFFELRQTQRKRRPCRIFYVVGKDEGKLVTVGPKVDVGAAIDFPLAQDVRYTGELKAHVAIFNGPSEGKSHLLPPPIAMAEEDGERSWEERLDLIVQALCMTK